TDLGHKALALAAEPRDAGTHTHVETALARVALLIVRDLLLARERVGPVGEAQTGERVHETRGEEPQGRPALAPRVADPRLCIDDECITAALLGPQRLAEELRDLVLYLALERGRALAPWTEHAEDDDPLSFYLVRHAHRGRLAHRRMRDRGRLDLRGPDAFARDLQRVVAAPLDAPVAVVIDARPAAVLP